MESISVVIPCYNASQTIRECLLSVIRQTSPVSEIIVVDDGSTDDSVKIIQSLQNSSDPPIKLFCQKNSGPSKARNTGIDKASGVWIAFLDSDDMWHRDKILIQKRIIKNYPTLSLCGIGFSNISFGKKGKDKIISFNSLCIKNYFITSGIIVRKAIIDEIKFNEDQKYSEDYRLWLEIAHNHQCIFNTSALCKNVENLPPYRGKGLSSKLCSMEKGELSNFHYLYKKRYISLIQILLFSSISCGKYIQRLFITFFKKD